MVYHYPPQKTPSCSLSFLSHSLKPQSIKVYLSALRNLHIEQRLPNPLEDATNLSRPLRGIKRLHGVASDTRLPITPNLLRSFRLHLNLSYIDHITLWAAMVTAFFVFLRSNELLALLHDDIQQNVRGYHVCIKRSKTNPFCTGATIALTPSGDNSLCPVTALDHLRAVAPRKEGLLFRLQSGKVLT